MLALSTSWQSGGSVTAEEMLAAIENTGIRGIELSYRIPPDLYRQLRAPLKRSGLKVVSIHNYFPIPSIKPDTRGSGDLFLLSSPDKEERRLAIHWTLKSIEHAAELSAAAVVLHCGCVEMDPEMPVLYQYYQSNQLNSEAAQIFIHNQIKQRDRRKAGHMDSLLSSLDHLVPVAEKQGVLLGLENRYHYHELPGANDFRLIFDRFKGAPIGYWHDTGHAHANEALGLLARNCLLNNYADFLVGIHLHDAVGLNDHIPPGSGEIDFKALVPFIKSDTIQVIELKPGIPASELLEGIRFVRDKLTGR